MIYLVCFIVALISFLILSSIFDKNKKVPLNFIRVLGVLFICSIGILAFKATHTHVRNTSINQTNLKQAITTINKADSIQLISWKDKHNKTINQPQKLTKEHCNAFIQAIGYYRQDGNIKQWNVWQEEINLTLYAEGKPYNIILRKGSSVVQIQFKDLYTTEVLRVDPLKDWLKQI